MSARNQKKPMYLYTPKRLRLEHGLSWHRIARAVDQGRIVPFACTGDERGCAMLFREEQLAELKNICAIKPRRRWVNLPIEAQGQDKGTEGEI